MNYFHKFLQVDLTFSKIKRESINGFDFRKKFYVGDILEVVVFCKAIPFLFEGICLIIRKRSFLHPELSFLIRNIILGVSIEVSYSFYYYRLYKLKRSDFKRKSLVLSRKANLSYIRYKLNNESRVRA